MIRQILPAVRSRTRSNKSGSSHRREIPRVHSRTCTTSQQKEATEQLNGSTHHCRESHAQLRRRTRVQHPDPTATSSSSLISSAFRLVARQIRSGQRRSTITVGTADWANLRTMPGTVRRDRAVEGARTTAIQTQRFLELQGLRGMSQRKRRSFVGNENRSN